jgi:type IV secretory pathway component VirB8
MSNALRDETVAFRDNRDVVAILKRLAEKDGLDVAALARVAVRSYLRERKDLDDQERRTLGSRVPA